MQVGLRRVACQFAVPLVPSQEAHRQASSHAKTGTGPTHTHPQSYCTVASGTAGLMCVCICVGASLFSIFMDHKRQMQKWGCKGLQLLKDAAGALHTSYTSWCRFSHTIFPPICDSTRSSMLEVKGRRGKKRNTGSFHINHLLSNSLNERFLETWSPTITEQAWKCGT